MALYFNYFSVRECLRYCSDKEKLQCLSTNSIDNILILLQVLDGFREFCNAPIIINSSFRDVEHNRRVGGSVTSQHMLGEAIDFSSFILPINTLCIQFRKFLQASSLERFLGQVIFYPTFIHIGLRTASHNKLVFYDKRKC